MKIWRVVLASSAVATAAVAAGQQFEVASVRVNTSTERRIQADIQPASGEVRITNMPVRELIQTAYGVQLPALIVDAPQWTATQRVDVTGKAPAPAPVNELQRMLQPLLAERFRLVVRREKREMDALALTVAPSGLGPRIKKTAAACDGFGTTIRAAMTPAQPTPGRAVCGLHPQAGPGRIGATGIDMAAFAGVLAPSQRRPVLDRTGLTDRYDLDFAYTPEAFAAAAIAQRGGAVPPGVDPAGPPLATALLDQLGLRLEAVKAPVEVIVVTRIEPLPMELAFGAGFAAGPRATRLLTLLADHLWQSTIFAALAALAALALRRHRAHVRYGIWLAASLKCLVPFAALAAIGGAFSWRTVEVIPYEESPALIETVSQPFTQTEVSVRTTPAPLVPSRSLLPALRAVLLPAWALGTVGCLLLWGVRWRRVRKTLRRATPLTSGREVEILGRLSAGRGVEPLPIFATDTTLEPGVFGIVRPVLLWPRGISDHLSEDQIEAILAHELCHLRRRDNLAAALHMVVQSVFWFHPLVWWIGARLVDERERACDEDVIRLGSAPEVYAESILKTCKFYLESPLVCVSGVTGSDLKKRIELIMTSEPTRSLPFWRQAALAVAGVVAFATPVVLGALNPPPQTRELAPAASLQAFEEVSIRVNPTPGPGGRGGQFQPTRWTTQNVTLKTILQMAFAAPVPANPNAANPLSASQIVGGPEWMAQEKFDIVAVTPAATQPTRPPQMREMIQRMLAERFKLKAHWETREMPVYALVRVRPDGLLASGLTPISAEECEKAKPAVPGQPTPPGQLPPCGGVQFGPGQLTARGAPMDFLAQVLTNTTVVTGLDRPVLNRTHLTGNYGFALKFSPAGGSGPPDPARAELFTALQEQLGLKLEPLRAPMDVLVIDSAEKPEAN